MKKHTGRKKRKKINEKFRLRAVKEIIVLSVFKCFEGIFQFEL